MIIQDITTNKNKFSNAKDILDLALSNTDITSTQYNTYYPLVNNLYNSNNNLLTNLSGNIGHKRAGNYQSISSVFDNPDNTMNEIVKSNSNYKILENCSTDIVSAVNNLSLFSDLKDSLPSVIDFSSFSDIFNWIDINYSDYFSIFTDFANSINNTLSSFGAIKDDIVLFIDNIRNLADDILHSSITDSPCLNEIGTTLLKYKLPESVDIIEQLKTGDKSKIISDKIDTFKIT